jgi:alkylation response protein AidB-like acyl-CoA dehydrogenase
MIESDFTEEQRAFRDAVREFSARALADVPSRDGDHGFSRTAWEKCAEFGILGLPVPTEYGGLGAAPSTTVLALEALGYGCRDNGLIFSLNAQMWACETPIVRFGTDEQKERYLPAMCDGSLIAAHGMSEPGSGSDAFSLRTTAAKHGDRYVLNGSKTFVTNAPEAGVFVLFATTDRSLGFAGLCAFLVDRDAPGLSVGPPLAKMGLRSSPMGEVFLDDCEIHESQLLGRRGGGMAIFNSSIQWERSCILASAVGTMQRQLERCVAHAREREQFGHAIGEFQAVAHRIVNMKVRLETSRLLLYRLARLMDERQPSAHEAALVKLHLSESFVQSSLDAVHVHGGYGYMEEYELERELRDAIGGRYYSGTSDMQKNIIARQLGL